MEQLIKQILEEELEICQEGDPHIGFHNYIDGKPRAAKKIVELIGEPVEQTTEQESVIDRLNKELDIVHQCLTDLYNDREHRIGDRVKKCLDQIKRLPVIPSTKFAEEKQRLHEQSAELSSLRQSILESPLHNYFPKKEMTFHDKVVFAISSLTASQTKGGGE